MMQVGRKQRSMRHERAFVSHRGGWMFIEDGGKENAGEDDLNCVISKRATGWRGLMRACRPIIVVHK
jgi:hypothetical protein